MSTDITHEQELQVVRDALSSLKDASSTVKNNFADMQRHAATSAGREELVSLRRRLADWRLLMASGVRDLAEADRLLGKLLKNGGRLRA